MVELREEDVSAFRNFVRVEPRMFQELLDWLGPRLEKKNTWCRKALVPGLKLAITLRHLTTGDSYKSLMFSFRVAHNTISNIISNIIVEVCEAILAEYADEVISTPSTPEGWMEIAEMFGCRWNFHHALGALDGKHIRIRCPANAGSLYNNYKGYHSVVLMALVDADYKFVWVSCGANGSVSDTQLWNQCELKTAIEDKQIGFPDAEPLPGDDQDTPFFFIGDDAFALKTFMMKPFSRRNMYNDECIFNDRLSGVRRIIENTFGILANPFMCLLTAFRQKPDTVVAMVMSCCSLHNLMRLRYPTLQNMVVDQEGEAH
uniref:putative nuclease HARBI1 n=1 Tax=Myxine glutinosa TaxID=7769 RepID=UPI0035901E0C